MKRLSYAFLIVTMAFLAASAAQAATTIEVTPEAALGGSNFGLEVQFDGVGVNNAFVQDNSPADEIIYRFGFRAALGTFDSAIGDIFYIATARSGDPNNLIRVWIRKRDNGLYQLRVIVRRDSGSSDNRWHQVGGAGFAADSSWFVEWTQATGDGDDNGRVRIWKNGNPIGDLTGIDNDERSVGDAKIGNTNTINVSGTIDTTTTGEYYLDTFESFRTLAVP